MSTASHAKTLKLVQASILGAILIIMAITPIGYLKVGVVSISFLAIPVVICGIVCGPLYGGIIGLLFGLTSVFQCFGLDVFGTTLMNINAFGTFVMCLVPRVLIGVFSALVFRGLSKTKMPKAVTFSIAGLIGALTNTVLFVGGLFLFFYNSDYISGLRGGLGLFAFAAAFVGVNGLIEAIVCMIVSALVSVALIKFVPANKTAK